MTMEILSVLHKTNILLHIFAGSFGLLTGILILITTKGRRFHRKAGLLFLLFLTIVIVTGLAGVFVFRRNPFLLVITVLSGYSGYSGFRILKNKSNRLNFYDIGVALLSLLVVIYFLYYFKKEGMIWAPVIIYSTVGYMILLVTYDLIKYLIPSTAYHHIWLYDHILKMISAFSALLSAFSGTVFPQYQPYSQFLPSVFGTILAIGFIISNYRRLRISVDYTGK